MSGELGPVFLALLLVCSPNVAARAQQAVAPGQTAASGDIRGKVTVSRPEDSADEHIHSALFGRYAAQGTKGTGVLVSPKGEDSWKLSERAVVYLERDELNRGAYSVPARHPLLDQKGLQFHPQVLPILMGTTVDFPNRDNLFHNVFSYSSPREFDLGRYPLNDSRSVMFDKPGVVRVYCDIHSHMSATILVLQHPYFVVPDDEGNYVISNVPEGRYGIVLWYGRDVLQRKSVSVRSGESIVVNFSD